MNLKKEIAKKKTNIVGLIFLILFSFISIFYVTAESKAHKCVEYAPMGYLYGAPCVKRIDVEPWNGIYSVLSKEYLGKLSILLSLGLIVILLVINLDSFISKQGESKK